MANKDRQKDSKSKSYSEEFKRSAVELVTHQNYSIAGAARAVGGERAEHAKLACQVRARCR
jgi:transposase-like protein